MLTLLTIVKSRLGQFGLVFTVGMALGAYGAFRFDNRTPTVVERTTENTKMVFVDRPVLDTKIVTKFLPDPKSQAEAAKLMAENAQLKQEVTTLTDTIATATSKGSVADGGVITQAQPPTVVAPTVAYTHFQDWQLSAYYSTKDFTYALTQQFEVVQTTGRDAQGSPVSATKVFQIGANKERLPLEVKTTAIYADNAQDHLILSPRLQLGLAETWGPSTSEAGGIVAVQWLKRGKSPAAEDLKWAYLTPSLYLSSNKQALTTSNKEIGVMPLSYNLGSIKHSPFTNLWVSPLWNPSGLLSAKRAGVVVSATF